ncbi:hydroxymethylbilane synthase [Parvularcula marina]|uniref:hydroxymethylbilane synthase n=1 Tax=Parvularcula marina TaxID=2292771 RepID=UPI0035189114
MATGLVIAIMSFKPLAIASRQSPLAVRQAELVRDLLGEAAGIAPEDREVAFPLKTYVSTGDKLLAPSLSEIGGKGLFTKEVEDALLSGEADIAVHSMKDMPAEMPDGLILAAVPAREDYRDALVSPGGLTFDALPEGARIGTSSIRRRAQLSRLRPDVTLVPMRGNVGTRLDKLARGEADATFLAEAGLKRLGRDDVTRTPLSPDIMLPAPGQGILCIQARADNEAALELCARINCQDTALASTAERALVKKLDASCRTPLAALATLNDGELSLRAEILMPDGTSHFGGYRELPAQDRSAPGVLHAAGLIGESLARHLIEEAGDQFTRIFGAS